MTSRRDNQQAGARPVTAGAALSPQEEIKRLYFNATRATIRTDLARAIELLKALPDEDARQHVAVYMDGLSQMRSEWAGEPGSRSGRRSRRR
jgi:hypothetical protein